MAESGRTSRRGMWNRDTIEAVCAMVVKGAAVGLGIWAGMAFCEHVFLGERVPASVRVEQDMRAVHEAWLREMFATGAVMPGGFCPHAGCVPTTDPAHNDALGTAPWPIGPPGVWKGGPWGHPPQWGSAVELNSKRVKQ